MQNAENELSETFIDLEDKNFHNIPYTFLKTSNTVINE